MPKWREKEEKEEKEMAKKVKTIRYKKEWFNPLFFIVRELINRGVVEFYIYGGKGSAKTITIAQTIAMRTLRHNHKAICFRKETSTIKTTLKPSFEKAIESVGLDNYFKNLEFKFRGKQNKADITLKGIDKAAKVKGIEGFADTYHDELDQFTNEDYTESVNAHRGEVAKVKFFSWNPTDINSWINIKVIKPETWLDTEFKLPSPHSFVKISEDGQKALIKTVYQDNYWLAGSPCGTYGYKDTATINRYERMRFIDEHWHKVNVLGEWGVIKPEDPFFEKYSREKHVSSGLTPVKYLPICLSFDFNIKDSCIAGQVDIENRRIRVLKEFRGRDLVQMVYEIVDYFGRDYDYTITGDATGNNQNPLTEGNISAFRTIHQAMESIGLQLYNRVGKVNLSLSNSRMTNNAILYMEHDYLIDEDGCPETIADIERMRRSVDGGLDKEHANKNNYGHLGDCFRYFNDKLLTELYENYDIVKWYEDKKNL